MAIKLQYFCDSEQIVSQTVLHLAHTWPSTYLFVLTIVVEFK